MEEQLKVTSIEEIKNMLNGELIKISPFTGSDKPFVVRVKKPSLLGLVKSGRIPNQLLSTSNGMFRIDKNNKETKEETNYDELIKIMDVIIEATLVEPTYQELKDNGIELNDQQIMDIFDYTQSEVKAITPSV